MGQLKRVPDSGLINITASASTSPKVEVGFGAVAVRLVSGSATQITPKVSRQSEDQSGTFSSFDDDGSEYVVVVSHNRWTTLDAGLIPFRYHQYVGDNTGVLEWVRIS